MISEIARIASENLPSLSNWLTVMALSAPALGAVFIRVFSIEDRILEVSTQRQGRSFPEGRGNCGIEILDGGKEAAVPSGGEGRVKILQKRAGNTSILTVFVKDFRRIRGKPDCGYAVVDDEKSGKKVLTLDNPERKIFGEHIATYKQNDVELGE